MDGVPQRFLRGGNARRAENDEGARGTGVQELCEQDTFRLRVNPGDQYGHGGQRGGECKKNREPVVAVGRQKRRGVPRCVSNDGAVFWAPQEFQVTRDNCFLRDSHSAPERSRGATSIRRGVSLKTPAAFQGRPSRVRYSRTLRASAMLVKEMSWTIISARKRSVCISRGSSSRCWQSEEMRRPKGISSEAARGCSGSGEEEVSTSRSHSRATRVQPASCILER